MYGYGTPGAAVNPFLLSALGLMIENLVYVHLFYDDSVAPVPVPYDTVRYQISVQQDF
jgi:hypothetical protein